MAAVLEANVAPIKQDPVLQATYASLDSPPPEALRRPVSISAVAHSLGLPFETARRRVRRLTDAGRLISTPRGLVLPQEVLASPEFMAIGQARYERLKQFHRELTKAGLLPPAGAGASPVNDEPPVRVANRALGEYLMRCIEGVLPPIGDPVAGLILLHMLRANAEHIADLDQELDLRPVTIAGLARRLRMPHETVRRRVIFLERAGYCRRRRGGVAVSPEGLRRPALQALVAQNLANVQRMFVQLARLGVLEAWRREGPGPSAP
jgi:DNA-binding Lrp family transcriptional regulator